MLIPNPEFWETFKKTPGAFSTAEALALYNIVLSAPEGIYCELGSHRGKSSQAIAYAISQHKRPDTFIMVEPEFKDEDWLKSTIKPINEMLHVSGFGYYADTSLNVIPEYNEIAFCFVDSGTHSDDLVMNESKMLEDKIAYGGIIAYHDKGSQFTRVDEAYDYLVSTGKYEPITIDWQPIFDYVKEHDLENGNNSWHLYPELPHPPNFVGALRKK